jgi:hypothetical protein
LPSYKCSLRVTGVFTPAIIQVDVSSWEISTGSSKFLEETMLGYSQDAINESTLWLSDCHAAGKCEELPGPDRPYRRLRRPAPAAVGDERRKEPHHHREQGSGDHTACERDDGRANHDDHQSDGGE